MQELKGDIWDLYDKGNWIVIPTNGTVKKNGEAVMGRGLALQARMRFPDIPRILGFQLGRHGLVVTDVGKRIITFPVKYNWFEEASINLITKSTLGLIDHVLNPNFFPPPIYLPRVGCGNGKLDWKDVKPILEKYLDDRFVVVNND